MVDANEGVLEDFFATVHEGMGSITKLLLVVLDPVKVTEEGVRTAFEAGITCSEEPAVVTTRGVVVGIDTIAPVEGGSGIKPLRLAKISATFLRSACVGLAVPLICSVTVELRACFNALLEAPAAALP